ncbi:MAG: amidohydrolase family protein [Candidatus Giovannonibacteria bacterium]|nr:amidohydrolase family protein [Candidatus Giovannonibacteria bacterium]
MAFSILIKNGTILDGSGAEPYAADLGISAGRIEKIGNLAGETAERIIDATNLYVTPGFIDITNHSDVYGTLFSVPSQESLLRQGVTTILVGNCGESLAPVVRRESLTELERWTTGFSVPINWNSVAEYYENIENLGVGPNVATLVGQETLKRNAKTLEEKIFLLESALREGAWGLSSNFSFAERGSAADDEILALLKIIKKYNGLYKIHLKDEGKNFLPSISAAVSLARASGARTVVSHLKAIGRDAWGDFGDALKIFKKAQSEGVDINFDVSPYLRTGSALISFLPSWARIGTNEEILKRISDKEISQKIINELKSATLHAERILIASAFKDKSLVGKTLEEISKHTGAPAEESILEILKINGLNVSVFGKTLNGRNLLLALTSPGGIVSGDGSGYDTDFRRFGDLVHPRSFGAFPRFFSAISAKAKISLAEAVAKMTSLPAKALGLKNRGTLKPKNIADIAIFNPAEFKDQATYGNPYRYASGLRFLVISGNLAVSEGELAAERHGLVLRKKN